MTELYGHNVKLPLVKGVEIFSLVLNLPLGIRRDFCSYMCRKGRFKYDLRRFLCIKEK